MAQDLQKALAEVNEALTAVMPFKLAVYNPHDLELLGRNAQVMRNQNFKSLAENIAKDKALSSVPLVYHPPSRDRGLVISGNHRTEAARAANVEQMLCLVIDWEEAPDQQAAREISHNSLVGEFDLAILKERIASIQDLNLQAYAGIDDVLKSKLKSISWTPIQDPRLQMVEVAILFFPSEVSELAACVESVGTKLEKDQNYVQRREDYDAFFKAVADCKAKLNIKNTGLALMELVRRGSESLDAGEIKVL